MCMLRPVTSALVRPYRRHQASEACLMLKGTLVLAMRSAEPVLSSVAIAAESIATSTSSKV